MEYTNGVSITHIDEPWLTDIRDLLLRVGDIYHSGALLRDDETLNALETVLIKLRRYSEEKRDQTDERVSAAVEFVHRRYADPISSSEIADSVNLSVNWLTTLFTRAMGVGPAAYLERVRLSRAAEMLTFSTSSVESVAAAVGYADPFYFARRFRLHYGRSPSQFRSASRALSRPPDGETG